MSLKEETIQVVKPKKFFGARHAQYVLLFCVLIIAYGIRTILSVAVYAMISEVPLEGTDSPTYPEWADKKNLMLSSFFWGYICFQIVAGQLAKNYGPKWFLGGTTFLGSLSCLLLPFAGKYLGYGGVLASRIITGMTQGFIYPSVHNLLSSWVALQDRAKIGTFVYAGGPLGNVIAMPMAGFMSNQLGWTYVFYLYGAIGMVWSLFWIIFGINSPSKHKTISKIEKEYIESGIKKEKQEEEPTPWLSIFTSLPFWAILLAHSGQSFGFWTLQTEIPSYMQNIMDIDISQNSLLSALPYLVLWLLSLVFSPAADYLINKKNFSVGASRKLFNSIGMFIPAIALIAMSFLPATSIYLTESLLVIAVGVNAAIYSGHNVNHIDLSPVHAGTLMALTNSISNIFSLLAPLAVDLFKSISGYEETDKGLWTIVFCTAALVYILVATFYIFAASGNVQPWNTSAAKAVADEKRTSEKSGVVSLQTSF